MSKIDYILEQLKQGKNIAIVTDAGTPGISDPGSKLINIITTSPGLVVKIIPIPGVSALTAAASISGLPMDKFLFLGFPPHKKGRNKFFEEVASAKYTVVFYESTHRILKTLHQLKESLPREKRVVVCRELTKKFETIYRGPAEEIIKILASDKNNLRGEFVVIINHEK